MLQISDTTHNRSPKSANEWTADDLRAYNISVFSVPPSKFFPSSSPTALTQVVDPAILTSPCPSPYPNSETNADLPLHVEQYLNYLSLATHTPPLDPNRESAIAEFSAQTLKLLRFNGRERLKGGAREGEEREREGQEMVLKVIILTRYELPFTICATTCVAQTGVCLISVRPTMALLVLIVDPTQPTAVTESGPNSPSPNAEAHLIATAIAAFQTNNAKRSSRGLPPLDSMTVPGIVMHGTRPTFYFVPVTKELEESVLCGIWPENSKETKVVRCATVSGINGRDLEQGMDDPGYRRLALEHLLAFKELAKDHWQKLFEGF